MLHHSLNFDWFVWEGVNQGSPLKYEVQRRGKTYDIPASASKYDTKRLSMREHTLLQGREESLTNSRPPKTRYSCFEKALTFAIQ